MSCCNDQAICEVQCYIHTHLAEPSYKDHKEEFAAKSYSRWIAFEFLNALMDHPELTPCEVYDRLVANLFVAMANCAEKPNIYAIFCQAEDTLYEIMREFL